MSAGTIPVTSERAEFVESGEGLPPRGVAGVGG